MIQIENTEVHGFEAAIRGMRNPMNSWGKSDSHYEADDSGKTVFHIGERDLKLMMQLAISGPEHRKFMRFITVTADITAPLYWWKEYDTYKVGTVANSCSTMHKLHAKKFEREDFSTDHLIPRMKEVLDVTIANLNACRGNFLETQDKKWWWQMIQLLPSSYNQRRTVFLNYETLSHIYRQRFNHKLDEWRNFCEWMKTLPQFELLNKAR